MANNKKRAQAKTLVSLAIYKLMFMKEYDEISIKEICEEAGISRMSFYRLYSKKDDVFVDYCDDKFEEFFEEYILDKDIKLNDFIVHLFNFFDQNKRQVMVLKKANRQQLLDNQFESYTKYIISKSKISELNQLKDNAAAVPFLAGGILSVLLNWVDTNEEKSPQEMANFVISLLIK